MSESAKRISPKNLDEITDIVGKLVGKIVKLLINTQCLSSEEEPEEAAQYMRNPAQLESLKHQVATKLPEEVESTTTLPEGKPNEDKLRAQLAPPFTNKQLAATLLG